MDTTKLEATSAAVKFLLQRQLPSLFGNLHDEAKAHIRAIEQSVQSAPQLDVETGTFESKPPAADDHGTASE